MCDRCFDNMHVILNSCGGKRASYIPGMVSFLKITHRQKKKHNNCHKVKDIPEKSVLWIYDSTMGKFILFWPPEFLCVRFILQQCWVCIYCRFAPSPQSRYHISNLCLHGVSNNLYQNTNQKTEEEMSVIAPAPPKLIPCVTFIHAGFIFHIYLQ